MRFADIFSLRGGGFRIYLSDYKGFISLSNEGQLRGAKDVLHYLDYTFRGEGTGINVPNETYNELDKAGILKFDNDGWYFLEKVRVDFQNQGSEFKEDSEE